MVKETNEIREGEYCTQCGKYIGEGNWISRYGELVRYFFHLFKKYQWEQYFCSEECDKKFWKNKK